MAVLRKRRQAPRMLKGLKESADSAGAVCAAAGGVTGRKDARRAAQK
ncbi:MAG: hypothetical protein NC432_08170 [Roseburia sp.]|nr:hypothetical protein [Roseburia sp.]MCM1098663.1 hypothetical protein [Ruminococcus flavefaciens]